MAGSCPSIYMAYDLASDLHDKKVWRRWRNRQADGGKALEEAAHGAPHQRGRQGSVRCGAVNTLPGQCFSLPSGFPLVGKGPVARESIVPVGRGRAKTVRNPWIVPEGGRRDKTVST